MLNKFKPRYKTNKKITDWEPTPDSKSRTMDRDKGKSGQGGNFWIKAYTDVSSEGGSPMGEIGSKPVDIVTNEYGDTTFHLFRQFKMDLSRQPDTQADFEEDENGVKYTQFSNISGDFCITQVKSDGTKGWEKIYGLPTNMDGGYMEISNDGSTPGTWSSLFTWKKPEVFPVSMYWTEKNQANSLVYANGHIYLCAVLDSTVRYDEDADDFRPDSEKVDPPLQTVYPDEFFIGVYVIKINADTGEVVDDNYTHISMDMLSPSGYYSNGLRPTPYSENMPIFAYDKYQNKIVVIVKLQLRDNSGPSGADQYSRSNWGDGVFEIDPDTMTTTRSQYLNCQAHHYVLGAQSKNVVAFSPTHNYVVARTSEAVHATRIEGTNPPDYVRMKNDTAIFKFDKDWNLVDRKQYGYPDLDDQGNYFEPVDGFGSNMTQGQSNNLQIFNLFYSESKDKLYSRSRAGDGGGSRQLNPSKHGYTWLENVAGDLNYTFENIFRITEIEPSDLSVSSVKWPQWEGPQADNQYPVLKNSSRWSSFIGNTFDRYNAADAISPDGKYLYCAIVSGAPNSKEQHRDNILFSNNQKHYSYAPFTLGTADTANDHDPEGMAIDIIRFNTETGEYDRSWSVTGVSHIGTWPGFWNNMIFPQQIVTTDLGFTFNMSSSGNNPQDGIYYDRSGLIGFTNVDNPEIEVSAAYVEKNRDEIDRRDIVGAMVSENGYNVSTYTEPAGWMSTTEKFMWDEPVWYWNGDPPRFNDAEWNEGILFYTYYSSRQTLAEKEAYFNDHVHINHKMSDFVGESHQAYDQDNFIDTVVEVILVGSEYVVRRTYPKPFYRGNSGEMVSGGNGGLHDQTAFIKPYMPFTEGFRRIDPSSPYSNSALLPPLPETDHHVFYSSNNSLTWDDLPTQTPDNGTLELVDTTFSSYLEETVYGGPLWTPEFGSGAINFYRYKAIFDWEDSETGSTAEIHSVERFGLNSVTGKRNQIKEGAYAFTSLKPLAGNLMHYHGQDFILQGEEHKWDFCGPAFRTLDTSNLTSMKGMFMEVRHAMPVSGPTLSLWDTSNVTDMSYAFYNTTIYTTIELLWDTSSVTDMSYMFGSFVALDARTWDFSNVQNMTSFALNASVILLSDTLPTVTLEWRADADDPQGYEGTFECREIVNYLDRCWPGLVNYTILGFEDCVNWMPGNYTVMVANREITDSDLPMYGSAGVPSDTQLELINQYETSTRATRYVYKATFPWNNATNSVSLDWLEDVLQFGGNRFEDGRVAFLNSPAESFTGFSNPRFSVSNLTDFTYMFRYCRNFNQDLTNWDTSNATQMEQMFGFCDVFNGDVTNFDVSNVTNISGMFRDCIAFNQDISAWNTMNVVSADQTFSGASSFNQDLSEWCVSLLASEPADFATGTASWTLGQPVWGTCPRNENGSAGDAWYHIFVANGNDINLPVETDEGVNICFVDDVQKDYATEVKGQIFNGSTIKAQFDWDNSNRNVRMDWVNEIVQVGRNSETGSLNQVKNGNRAFSYLSVVSSDAIKNLDTSNLTDMTYMFNTATTFNTDISGWDTSSVTDMIGMFYSCYRFNQPIGSWDVSNLAQAGSMFYACSDFNGDISGWDTSSMTDMYRMFGATNTFNRDISGWDISNVTNMSYLFNNASNFNQDLSPWAVCLIESEPFRFDDGASSWTLPRPMWGVCGEPEIIVVSNTPSLDWSMLPTNDADNGTLALISDNGDGTYTYNAEMLYDNSTTQKSLTWLVDVTQFPYEQFVASYAFNGSPATSITALDSQYIAGENISYMFANMPNFNQDISGWDVAQTTNMEGMFNQSTSFNQNLSSWCVSGIASEPTLFSDGTTSWTEPKPIWGTCGGAYEVSRVREEDDLVGPNDQYASTSDAESNGWTIQGAAGDDSTSPMDVPASVEGVSFFGKIMPASVNNGTNGNITWVGGSSGGRSGNFVNDSSSKEFWLSHWNQDSAVVRQMHKAVGDDWVVRTEYKTSYSGSYGISIETTFRSNGGIKVVYGTVISGSIDIGETKQGIASMGEAIVSGFGDAANSLGDFVWEYVVP